MNTTDLPPRPVVALRDRLRSLVDTGDVLVLTGAGISTDSGIPDYRRPDGTRRHGAPMTHDTFTGSDAARQRYWARAHLGWRQVGTARPNDGHLAVAEMERTGLLTGTVTQNVDGLHSAAGSGDVIDLHGRLDRVECLECGDVRPRLEVALRLDAVNPGWRERVGGSTGVTRPDGDVALDDDVVRRFRLVACRCCGGALKPDVVYFGGRVPSQRFRDAMARLECSRALLVLGSSLMVGSGYRFATRAAKLGLPIAIVNRGVTRADHLATLKLDTGIAETLRHLR